MDYEISLFQYLQSLPQNNINLASSGMSGINPEGFDDSNLESILSKIYQVQEDQILLVPSGTFGSFFILSYLRKKAHKLYSIIPEYPVFFYQAKYLNYDIFTENRINDNSIDLSPWDVDEDSVYFLSNPNNPTGEVWNDESIRSILRETEGNNSYLVIDETFSFFDERYQRPRVDIGNLLIVGSISKFFGNSGAKLGWIVSKPEIIGEMRDEIRYILPEIGDLNKKRVSYLFKNINIYNSFNFKKLDENFRTLKEILNDYLMYSSIKIVNSLFVGNISSLRFANLISAKGINVVPGYFFGDDRIIRIGIGVEMRERIETAAKIILDQIQ